MKLNFGPRLKEFAFRPPEEDTRVTILEGSVRSGKTWALHPKILHVCKYPVRGWRFITGFSPRVWEWSGFSGQEQRNRNV